MNETLHKVFLCVFLGVASILVKIESHQSGRETKTVCHERGFLSSVVKPNLKRQHSVSPRGHGSVSRDHHAVWWGGLPSLLEEVCDLKVRKTAEQHVRCFSRDKRGSLLAPAHTTAVPGCS